MSNQLGAALSGILQRQSERFKHAIASLQGYLATAARTLMLGIVAGRSVGREVYVTPKEASTECRMHRDDRIWCV